MNDQQLITEIAAHPRSELIEALANAMHDIEDDDGNGRHLHYYRSLAYATVEILPGLSYDEDALCDEPGCGAHPKVAARTDAINAGREAAARDIRTFADQNPSYSNDNPGLQGLYDAEAIALNGLDPHRIHSNPVQPQ